MCVCVCYAFIFHTVSIWLLFLNTHIWYARLGRDFVGGIDNEALDFGQLESFVHMPAINTSTNNGNTSAITLAITAVSTTPAHTITTATASAAATNPPTHGTFRFHCDAMTTKIMHIAHWTHFHTRILVMWSCPTIKIMLTVFLLPFIGTLPESPPDSGSEPPYSPVTDLHAISTLNQIAYHPHNYPTNSQPANPHQLDQVMHVNETSGVDCHTANLVNGNNNPSSSIHKTEDILLSSTAMPLPNSVSSLMLPDNDMMMHQNVSKKNCSD